MITINQKDHQVISSPHIWGLRYHGEWIVETKRAEYANVVKYNKCFYPSPVQANTKRLQILDRHGIDCEVVNIDTGDIYASEE